MFGCVLDYIAILPSIDTNMLSITHSQVLLPTIIGFVVLVGAMNPCPCGEIIGSQIMNISDLSIVYGF